MKEKEASRFLGLIKNKFFIAIVIFIVWILFFDEYSVLSQRKNRVQLLNLIEQQNYYKEKIESDQQKLEELNSGKEELEKYAREQFHMSKPNEDLFLIVEE
jgi:cell division protein FtsB